jgi:hypothetical protein
MFILFKGISEYPEGPKANFVERDAKPPSGLTFLFDVLNPPVRYSHSEDWILSHYNSFCDSRNRTQIAGGLADEGLLASIENLKTAYNQLAKLKLSRGFTIIPREIL